PFNMDVERARQQTIGLDQSFRPAGNLANKHLQSRAAMQTANFSGIDGVKNQDYAIVETMGPVVNRAKEHLGASDRAVTAARRLLLSAVRAFQEGQDPPGLDPSVPVERVLSDDVTIAAGVAWRDACALEPALQIQPADEVALA